MCSVVKAKSFFRFYDELFFLLRGFMCQAFFFATSMHFVRTCHFWENQANFYFIASLQINLCTWSRFIFVLFNAWKLMGNIDRNAKVFFRCYMVHSSSYELKIKSNWAQQKKNGKKKGESNKFGWAKQTQSHTRQLKVVSVIVVTSVVLLQFQCIFCFAL